MHIAFNNFQAYYKQYLKTHKFYDSFFEVEEQKKLTDLTKKEALLPLLINYFILDQIFFPRGNESSYFGRLQYHLDEIVPTITK